jgi:hypothetical protein
MDAQGPMTPDDFARQCADKIFASSNLRQTVIEIADSISTLVWTTKPGRPPLTYEEKLSLVEKIGIILSPPSEGMTRLGGDNSRTLELIRAIRQLVR